MKNNDNKLQEKLVEQTAELLDKLERFKLSEYMQLLNSPIRFFWINFLGGVARGLGFSVGVTILGALLIYFLQQLVVLNLPVIGDFIAEIVKIVQKHL
ncbi:DUF5665 domain-containing protein [Natranaerobius trueperi]|nr:DUF5665 domain-containing protein [Natranaerobius trueperi]